jgi:hypothetical protein
VRSLSLFNRVVIGLLLISGRLLYLALIKVEWLLFLITGDVVFIQLIKLVLVLLHSKVLLNVRLREIEKLSFRNNLSLPSNRHLNVLLDILILIPDRSEFLVISIFHPHELGLTLRNSGAKVLLIILIKTGIVASWLFILTLLRILLLKLILKLCNNLVLNLYHFLLLVLILLKTFEILLLLLVFSLHL